MKKICYYQGYNDIGDLIATRLRNYLFHLQPYFSAHFGLLKQGF